MARPSKTLYKIARKIDTTLLDTTAIPPYYHLGSVFAVRDFHCQRGFCVQELRPHVRYCPSFAGYLDRSYRGRGGVRSVIVSANGHLNICHACRQSFRAIDSSEARKLLLDKPNSRPQGVSGEDLSWALKHPRFTKTVYLLGFHFKRRRTSKMRVRHQTQQVYNQKQKSCNRPRKGQQQVRR